MHTPTRSLLALLATAAPAAAQLTWTTDPNAALPSPRFGHAVVQMTSIDDHWLFGGLTGSGPVADTWRRDTAGWQAVATTSAPSARSHAAFAAIGSAAFLFGGRAANGSVLGDTWQLSGSDWAPVNVPGPAARAGAAMAFGPGFASTSFELVLFGGTNGTQAFGDLWTFADFQWTQRNLTVSPPARSGHAMVFENNTGVRRVVLFGGVDGNGSHLDDTWTLASPTPGGQPVWVQANPATRPPARAGHSMRLARHRGRIQVYGGLSATGVLGDLWEWDGAAWQSVPTNAGPVARFGAVLLDAPGNPLSAPFAGELLGGADGTNPFGDAWQLTSTNPPSRVPFGPLATLQAAVAATQSGVGTPWLGDTLAFQLSAPLGQLLLPHLIVGFSNTISPFGPLPLQLAAFDNQTLLVSPDQLYAMPGTGSTAQLLVPVPNLLSLVGAHVFLQGIGYVQNLPGGSWAVSSGFDCVFGVR